MKQHLQNTLIKNLSDYGCYWLCLCQIAEETTGETVDVINEAIKAMDKGWLADDFTVLDPTKILKEMTGKTWTCIRSEDPPKDTNEIPVMYYYNERTKYGHFRTKDWDSLKDSVTVKEGKVISYRNFSVIS